MKHILHVIPSFGIGGVPLRMARVINHLGCRFRHSIIALDADFSAVDEIHQSISVEQIQIGNRRRGLIGRLIEIRCVFRNVCPDLLLTYNWGSIEWAFANRLLPVSRHIHLEAGFGAEEADQQLRHRVILRRCATAKCERIVVPSRYLENVAMTAWHMPRTKVLYLPNGIDTARFPIAREPSLRQAPSELVIGTIAPLRPEKNIGRLIRAFSRLDAARPVRLVIAGDGSERPMLEKLAVELEIGERVTFLGRVAPEAVLPNFDIFALSSDTEQMPNALLEAMAAGRAVAAVDVGDVKCMVCPENRTFIVPRDDGAALSRAIAELLLDVQTRLSLGKLNRQRTETLFSQQQMLTRYAQLLEGTNSY